MFILPVLFLLQEGFAPPPRPVPEPTPIVRPHTTPIIDIDPYAVADLIATETAVTQPEPREVILYVGNRGECPHCETTERALSGIHPEYTLTIRNWRESGRRLAAIPCLYLPDVDEFWYGSRTIDGLKAILAAYPAPKNAPTAQPPMHLGTINLRATIDKLLSDMKSGWVELGPVGVNIPDGCEFQLYHANGSRLTFSGAKPRIRVYGLEQPVNSLAYGDGKLTIDWQVWWLPDATLEVK